jgi:hypothetical protein
MNWFFQWKTWCMSTKSHIQLPSPIYNSLIPIDGFFNVRIGYSPFIEKVVIPLLNAWSSRLDRCSLDATAGVDYPRIPAQREAPPLSPTYRLSRKSWLHPLFSTPVRAIAYQFAWLNIILSIIVNNPGEPLPPVQEDGLDVFKSEAIPDLWQCTDQCLNPRISRSFKLCFIKPEIARTVIWRIG